MSRCIRLAALSAVVLVSLALAAPALAHSELVSAVPGPGDEVVGPPTEVVGQFSQDLDPSRTSMSVRDVDGTVVAEGGDLGDGPREWILPLPELTPGEYEVRYTTFSSEDSELHRDSWTFTVVAAPTPSPSPTPSPTIAPTATQTATPEPASPTPAAETPVPSAAPSSPSSDGENGGILAVVAAVVAFGAIAVWALRRRPT